MGVHPARRCYLRLVKKGSDMSVGIENLEVTEAKCTSGRKVALENTRQVSHGILGKYVEEYGVSVRGEPGKKIPNKSAQPVRDSSLNNAVASFVALYTSRLV